MRTPITIDILQIKVLYHVKSHDQESNYKLFSQVYLEDNKQTKSAGHSCPTVIKVPQSLRLFWAGRFDSTYKKVEVVVFEF